MISFNEIEQLIDFPYENVRYGKLCQKELIFNRIELIDNLPHNLPHTLYVASIQQLDFLKKQCPEMLLLAVPPCGSPVSLPGENVLLVYTEDSPEQIKEYLMNCLYQRELCAEICLRLHKALFHKSNLNTLIEIAYDYLQNPIIVSNNAFRIIGFSYDRGEAHSYWRRCLASKRSSYEDFAENKKLLEDAFSSRVPLIVTAPRTGEKILESCIGSPDDLWGFLAVFESGKKLTGLDIEIVSILQKVLCVWIQQNIDKVQFPNANRKLDILIRTVINNSSDFEESCSLLEKVDMFHKASVYHVAKIMLHEEQGSHIPIHYYAEKVDQFLSPCYCMIYHSHLIAILFRDNREAIAEKSTFESFCAFLNENNLMCGLSDPFLSVRQLTQSYRQASSALKFNEYAGGAQNVFVYHNFSMLHLLQAAEKSEDLMFFCDFRILKLMADDCIHQSNHTEILRELVVRNFDTNAVAIELHMHRNTLYYHCRKIEEISSLDFRDKKNFIPIRLTIYVLSYLLKGDFSPNSMKNLLISSGWEKLLQ